MTTPMRLRAALGGLLLLALGAAAHALPPAVEAERLALKAKSALDAKDYAAASEALDRLAGLGVPLPDQIDYLRGIAAKGIGRPARALKFLDAYFDKTGTRGKYFTQALAAYNEAEDAVKKAEADYAARKAAYEEAKAQADSDLEDCLANATSWGEEIKSLRAQQRWAEADAMLNDGTPTYPKCRDRYRAAQPSYPESPALD